MLDKLSEKSPEPSIQNISKINESHNRSTKGIANHIKMRLGLTSRQSITTNNQSLDQYNSTILVTENDERPMT